MLRSTQTYGNQSGYGAFGCVPTLPQQNVQPTFLVPQPQTSPTHHTSPVTNTRDDQRPLPPVTPEVRAYLDFYRSSYPPDNVPRPRE